MDIIIEILVITKKKNPFYFNPISNFSRGKFKLNLVEDLNENSFNVIP